MSRTFVLSLLMMIVSVGLSYSQGTGLNFDFNQYPVGNFANWRGYQAQNITNTSGTGYPLILGPTTGYTPTPQNPIWKPFNIPEECYWKTARCFVINSNLNEYDPIAPSLKKIPEGYTRSAQINCAKNDKNANMLTYDLNVNDTNCLLTFNFAILLEQPSNPHPGYQSPFFQIEVVALDLVGSNLVEIGRVDPCAFFEVMSHTTPPDWGTFPSGSYGGSSYIAGIWQDWRQVSMNLSSFTNTKIRIKVTLASCSLSGHWAYGYFVGKVGPSVLNVTACGNEGEAAHIEAPKGFQSYEWYANPEDRPEHELGAVAATQPILHTGIATLTQPADNTFSLSTETYNDNGENYFVKVTSPSSSAAVPGCVAYIKTNVRPIKPLTHFTDSIDCQLTAVFNNLTVFPLEDQDGEIKEFMWDFGDGVSANYINTDPTTIDNISPSHIYAAPGAYTVKLLARYNGCEKEYEKLINIPATPSFHLLDSNICMGQTIDISIQNPAMTNDVVYTWTNLNDATTFVGQVYSGSFNERTEIKVSAVSPDCTYIDTVIIDVQEFPEITLTGDTMLCDGETAFITANDATGNTTEMQWSLINPGTPPQFNPNQPVTSNPIFTYTPTGNMIVYLIARTSQGCMGSKSINIMITDPKATANKYKVCPGDPVVLTGYDAIEYSWVANPPDATLTQDTSDNSVTAHPEETTIYTMLGFGESGCSAARTVKVTVIPYPEGEISYSPAYVDVDNPVLSIKDVSKYGVRSSWNISDGTTSELRSFSHKFNDVSGQNVTIYLTTLNEVGCADTASVVVPIELFSVWVPNAFSPDGDQKNDKFFFHSLNSLNDVKLEIYNKWGEKLYLFERSLFDAQGDMSNAYGWDGKHNGKDVPVGSYVWRLTYKRIGNERIYDKSGTIGLIR